MSFDMNKAVEYACNDEGREFIGESIYKVILNAVQKLYPDLKNTGEPVHTSYLLENDTSILYIAFYVRDVGSGIDSGYTDYSSTPYGTIGFICAEQRPVAVKLETEAAKRINNAKTYLSRLDTEKEKTIHLVIFNNSSSAESRSTIINGREIEWRRMNIKNKALSYLKGFLYSVVEVH